MNKSIHKSVLIFTLMLGSGCGSHAKVLNRQQAVQAAEKFIVQNGYTNLPPLPGNTKLAPESLEWTSDRAEMLKERYNTLERKAYGFVAHGKGKPGWTIVFRYKHGSNPRNGRAVTMDLDGQNKRVQHVDFILSKCHKL